MGEALFTYLLLRCFGPLSDNFSQNCDPLAITIEWAKQQVLTLT